MPGDVKVSPGWEEWRVVPPFPDYEASSKGRIRRRTPGRGTRVGRVLRTPVDAEGYPTVNLSKAPRRVHVLVAAAFLGPIPPGGEVHHRDERRANACVENLEIAASKLAHAVRHRGLRSVRRRDGEANALVACACGCGASLWRFDDAGRPRQYVSGHNIGHDAAGRFVAVGRG